MMAVDLHLTELTHERLTTIHLELATISKIIDPYIPRERSCMSLFGEEDRPARGQSSLFDDPPSNKSTERGLFGDDADPWSKTLVSIEGMGLNQ